MPRILGPAAAGRVARGCDRFKTFIDIRAPKRLVWASLANDWGLIQVTARQRRRHPLEARARARAIRWLNRWAWPGTFSSEPRCNLEWLPEGGVRFHHGVQVQGIMTLPLIGQGLLRTRAALDAMYAAHKQRAERAYAKTATTAS